MVLKLDLKCVLLMILILILVQHCLKIWRTESFKIKKINMGRIKNKKGKKNSSPQDRARNRVQRRLAMARMLENKRKREEERAGPKCGDDGECKEGVLLETME